MVLAKSRLSKEHVHCVLALFGHVPDDEDLEVMEIRSSPSSSRISTVCGVDGLTGRITGRKPSTALLAGGTDPLAGSDRTSPVILSI